MTIQITVDLESIFLLIQQIKQNIKQKCDIEILSVDNLSTPTIRILISTKNRKTGKWMYIQEEITEEQLYEGGETYSNLLINKLIKEANYYFEEQQSENRIDITLNTVENL